MSSNICGWDTPAGEVKVYGLDQLKEARSYVAA